MDRCSFFIEGKAMFGSYPVDVAVLEEAGVRVFVDLTFSDETMIVPYKTNYRYISYPISDQRTPTDWKSFTRFILQICQVINDLKDDEKLYLHCKGGHGRSGVVVACVLCHLLCISTEEALDITNTFHNNRETMREKWRIIGAPQTRQQKCFVHRFFSPIYFANDPNNFLSTFSFHSIIVNGITFRTVEAAYQAHKDFSNTEYVNNLKLCSGRAAKVVSRSIQLPDDWSLKKVDVMYTVIKLKFEQHPDIKEILLRTGLRPFVKVSKYKSFWSITGENMMGKILERIRLEYYNCVV